MQTTAEGSTTLYLPLWGCVVWFDGDTLMCVEEGDYMSKGKMHESVCEVSAPPCQDYLDRINRHYGTSLKMEDFAGR